MALFPTKKITALPPAALPLTGFEQLECVQTGTSSKVTSRDFVLPTDSIITLSAMGGSLPGSRQLISSPTAQVTDNGPGSTVQIDVLGTGALPGNPTTQIGLVAVNGVAVTWMRSDAAPALDQSIAPTWTGIHTFGSAQPETRWNETDAAANNRLWGVRVQGEQFSFGVLTDLGVFSAWVNVDRTAQVVDIIDLLTTSLRWNGSPILSAATAFANPTALVGLAAVNGVATTAMRSDAAPALDQGIAPTWTGIHTFANATTAILMSSTAPRIMWNETDAAANNRLWRLAANAEQLVWGVRNDADNAGADFMTVDRTLNVVDAIAWSATAMSFNGIFTFTKTGVVPAGYPILLSSADPFWAINETDGAANNRLWDFGAGGEALLFRTLTDAGSATTWMQVDRTAATVDSIVMTATTFTFTGTVLNPKIRQLREQFSAVVWAAGANNLDLSAGNLHRITLNGNVTLAFTNPPPNSTLGITITIFLLQDGTGNRTVTWPASVHWSDGLTPVLTTTANRMDAVTLTTFDGGTTYYGGQVLANMVP